GEYVLYLGREKPGTELLAPAFDQLTVKLVVAGSAHVDRAINLGRVSLRDKWFLLARAMAVVQPSRLQSLGLTLIEALQARKPVLVNGECAVLRDEVENSGGGLIFDDAAQLRDGISRLQRDPDLCQRLASAGARYAARYDWDAITDFFSKDL